MSHYRLKTNYQEDGVFGSYDTKTLFVHHNLSCDYVSFYYEDGTLIMTIPDTIDNNLLDAINRLYAPFVKDSNGFVDGVESMTQDDREKIK